MNSPLFILARLGQTRLHILLIALCSWAIWLQLEYRVPGELFLFLLPAVSTAVGLVTALVWITRLMGRTPIEKPFRKIFHAVENGAQIFIIGFFAYSVFLLSNAQLDPSRPSVFTSELLEIKRGKIEFGYSIPYAYVKLRSWEDSQNAKWLILKYTEAENLWFNQPVLVKIHDGYFSLPWISSVEPDREKQLRQVVSVSPGASIAWQQLISHYIEHHRWSEATRASAEYLNIYPKQRKYLHYVASSLLNARQFEEMISLLEPLAAKGVDYQVYIHLGFALAMKGRKNEGLRLIQTAITTDPEEYFGYYALGYAHVFTGNPLAAVPYFEKVLKLRPNYPEIEDQLKKIKTRPTG